MSNIIFIYFLIGTCHLLVYACPIIVPNYNILSQTNKESKSVIVTFKNIGNSVLDIIWIDDKRSEVSLGILNPNASHVIDAFSGDAWRIRRFEDLDAVFETVLTEKVHEVAFEVGQNCIDSALISPSSYAFKSTDEYAFIDESHQPDITASMCADDLPNWISRHIVVPGYHILCISSIKSLNILTMESYLNGYDSSHQKTSDIHYNHRYDYGDKNIAKFRLFIESALNITFTDRLLDDIKYSISNRIEKRKLLSTNTKGDTLTLGYSDFVPQPWNMFTTDRHPVSSLDDILQYTNTKPSIFLVFTGGQFIYPGIDIGFTRNVTVSVTSEVTIETLSIRPLVLSIASFLSNKEADYIIQKSVKNMAKSGLIKMDIDRDKKTTQFRTSSTYFLKSLKSDKILSAIDNRVANITGCSVKQQESMQVLRYRAGEYYMSHLDFWDPAFYSDPSLVVRIQGGHKNRFSTVFWYLSDCEGGETAFPRAPLHVPHVARSFDTSKDTCTSNATSEMIQNITKERDIASLRKECSNSVKIAPVKGKSIIFYSLLPDGRGDQLSEHSACEVVKGEKWAVNKWIWSANF